MEVTDKIIIYTVNTTDTIEDVWSIIDKNNHRSAIVMNDGKVVGTLSDGDLRQAILNKRLLTTPVQKVMNVNFISLTQNKKNDWKKVVMEKDIFLLPIVDEEMNLLDIMVRDSDQ